jgi:GT2 family glycosyltransferase
MEKEMISIITPWLNHSELCPMYERGVKGAEVIIVDNGSEWMHAQKIGQMVERLGGKLITNKENRFFAPANNQGLQVAAHDIVLFVNNDVELRPWFLPQVEADVKPGALYGPSAGSRYGQGYIEGYCIAATRDTWETIGGWPEDMPGMYWEDNLLCLRAERKGIKLVQTTWGAWHHSNYTSRQTPGAYDHSAGNEQYFLKELRCS